MFGIIYKITNKLNGKRYIGQTKKDAEQRFREHVYSKRKFAMCLAIQKYGKENFEITILAHCNSLKEMNHREQYYIRLFNTLSPSGYNLRSGGSVSPITEDAKKKISFANKGKSYPHTKESKQKISLANSNRVWKTESKNKLSIQRMNKKTKPHSVYTKNLMSKAQNKNKVKILCIQNNTVYESVKKASRELNLNKSHIFSILAGTRNHTKGYAFVKA